MVRVEANGKAGTNATNGVDGEDGGWLRHDAKDGAHASVAGPGESGGALDLTLSQDTSQDTIARLAGELVRFNGSHGRVERVFDFSTPGYVELLARGGRGGDGGNGGKGGDGSRGSSGVDAGRFVDATDGGRGGRGGDGGEGSSGGEGGNGGRIVLRLSEYDTHLLMLVAHDVSAAEGGKAGANGKGGSGGRGGKGGDGHTWTETTTKRDWQGHEHTHCHTHTKSGANDGLNGSDGSDASALLYDGAHGEKGSFAIEIVERAGLRSYPGRYDLTLVGFRHRNENDDGIYEPEETIYVTEIEVENTGLMPTPAHHDIVIRVVETNWIAPGEAKLVVPRSLAPGERHRFRGLELPFKLRVFNPQRTGDAFNASETISLQALLPRVRRTFGDFATTAAAKQMGRFEIRFPIEISPLTSLFSLAPGEAARLRWTLRNVSERDFGLDGGEGRAVAVKVMLVGGDLGPDQVHVFDESGARAPLEHGFVRNVGLLGSKYEKSFEVTVAISEDAPPHASARLVLVCELGHVDSKAQTRPIQYQEFVIRVGQSMKSRQADVLVVANNRTTREEVEAWHEVIGSFGLSAATCDVSLEGSLQILRDVAAGERRFRMVVLLDNPMDTADGPRHPSELLDQATTLALVRSGVHVLDVNTTKSSLIERGLVSTARSTATVPEILDEEDRMAIFAACTTEQVGGDGLLVRVRDKSEDGFERRAKRLASSLESTWPERRYVVAPYDHQDGLLMIRRTADTARGSLTTIQMQEEVLHDPRFVRHERTRSLLATALPFEIAVMLLSLTSLPYGSGNSRVQAGVDDALVASVLSRLSTELERVRHFGWRTSPENVARSLPLLAYIEKYAFSVAPSHDGTDIHRFGKAPTSVDPASHRGRRLVELCAWLSILAGGQVRLWEWLPPFVWLRRGRQLRARIRQAVDELLTRTCPSADDRRVVDEAIGTRIADIKGQWRDRQRHWGASRNGAVFTRERMDARFTGYDADDDTNHLQYGYRSLSAASISLREREEASFTKVASAAVRTASDARNALLIGASCGELLARATPAARVAPPESTPEASLEELEGLVESADAAARGETEQSIRQPIRGRARGL